MVELHLAKVDVAGSNPVSRSMQHESRVGLNDPDFPGRFFFATFSARIPPVRKLPW